MPTIAIEIVVDDRGAVQSFQRTEQGLQKIGQRGNVVMTGLSRHQEQARDAAQLLSRTIGAEIPRALEKVLARSSIVGPALASAFNVSSVLLFITAIAGVISHLEQAKEMALNVGLTFLQAGEQLFAWATGGESLTKVMAQVKREQELLLPLVERERSARREAAQAGLEGYSQIHKALNVQLEDIGMLSSKQKRAAEEQTRDENERRELFARIDLAANAARIAAHQAASAKIKDLDRKFLLERLGMEKQAALIGLSELGQIEERAAVLKREIDLRRDISHKQKDELKFEIDLAASRQTRSLIEKEEVKGILAVAQARASAAHGIEQVEGEKTARILQLLEEERIAGISTAREREAAEITAMAKILEIRRQAAENTKQLEEEAAVAILPIEQRATAQIAVEYQRRAREIQQQLADTVISTEQAGRQMTAAWTIAAAHMRDEMAGELESLFDDITTGQIGQRMLREFKRLVFQMVATWLLGIRQMQSVSAVGFGGGGGFGLGSILGGLFGMGTGGGGFGITGPGGTAPTFPLFLGGTSSTGAGATTTGLGQLPLFGPSVATVAGLPLSAGGGAGLGAVVPAGAAGSGFLASLRGPGGGGILMSMLGGFGLLGLRSRLGRGLGGALTGFLGGAALTAALAGNLGGFLGGGLAGLGGIFGSLATAAIPIAGAVIGLLLGLFLHGSTRKARLQIEENIKTQTRVIEDAYNVFQMDYLSAIGQLEQLRQQGLDALRQAGVKDISRARVGHVDQWIDAAIRRINATEAERQRRAQLAFGPGQFEHGGFVSPALQVPGAEFRVPSNLAQTHPLSRFSHPALSPRHPPLSFQSGGPVPAILHAGEFVMRREAVQRVGRPQLELMNQGSRLPGLTVNNYISAIDVTSFKAWLRRGGMDAILQEWFRARREGAV